MDEVVGAKETTSTVASPVSRDAPTTEVILTFDNLGEAADEELGLPVDVPHSSVVEALPSILSLLDGAGPSRFSHLPLRQHRPNYLPLFVRNIAGIGLRLAHAGIIPVRSNANSL